MRSHILALCGFGVVAAAAILGGCSGGEQSAGAVSLLPASAAFSPTRSAQAASGAGAPEGKTRLSQSVVAVVKIHYLGGSQRSALVYGGSSCSALSPDSAWVRPKSSLAVTETSSVPCTSIIMITIAPELLDATCSLQMRIDGRDHIRYHIIQKDNANSYIWCRYHEEPDGSANVYYKVLT